MANTVAHLMVAKRILELMPEPVGNEEAFLLGAVAPDAIESMAGADRDDKKRVHLRLGIRDMEWLEEENMSLFDARVRDFAGNFVNRLSPGGQRDFNTGYLVHLLTDKVNHATLRQKVLNAVAAEGLGDGNFNFFGRIINDLEALDAYLLREKPEAAEMFARLISGRAEYSLEGFIEKEYLERSLLWWSSVYSRRIEGKKARYLGAEDIENFIDLAAQTIAAELKRLIK